jgi:hypothetical protein
MDRRDFLKKGAAVSLILSPDLPPTKMMARESPSREGSANRGETIVVENADFQFVLGADGISRSLVHKRTGQECLAPGLHIPMFTLFQHRPYDEILQLAYPIKPTTYPVESARREGSRLIASFASMGFEASIGLKVTDAYIGFTMEKLTFIPFTSVDRVTISPVDETVFIQLPVRTRERFGDWLNVVWDDQVAVNVLATDPYVRIDNEAREGYYLLRAGTANEVRLEGAGAALIASDSDKLLDRIATLENDFNLPHGVESRRRQECRLSYYEIVRGGPKEIDRHVAYARQGGFRTLQVYYMAFAKTAGHLPWTEAYPRGMSDLQSVVNKVAAAGIIPGVHIHYNKSHREDAYVTPKPDPRLNVIQSFTLTAAIDATATTLPVAENPRLCTLDDQRRLLRIQNEIVAYKGYTTTSPYQFTGCQRGALNTHAESHEESTGLGLLDVDTWWIFIRFNQNTDIQEESARRWKKLYKDAGFKFVYFDGAEDVPYPYWFTTSWAQWLVYKKLDPEPLFSEGAVRSHFSWHMLSRGNTFNVFKPEVIKAATREFPAAEAARAANDFTRINFGWVGYWAPSSETMGTQPDMLEYVASRAAAWDCPLSLNGELDQLDAHPRTPDNLEVLKRWEDVRVKNWLSETQRQDLRNLTQEHILLINEKGDFELVPYAQVENAAGADRPVRAFILQRAGNVCVIYWHTSGQASLEVPLPPRQIRLMKELGKPIPFKSTSTGAILPLAGRIYVACGEMSANEVIAAFQRARVV